MPKLTFEADTQAELVAQVRSWLDSAEAATSQGSFSQVIDQGAGLTKDALRIIASAAPKPVAESELVRGLAEMGYRATDVTSQTLQQGLGAVESLTGGSVISQVGKKGRAAVFQMNAAVAKQVLKGLAGA